MQPATHDIVLYQGDTYVLEGTLSRNVGTEEVPDIQPIDLTDLTLTAQIRYRPTAGLVASFECSKVDAAAGQFRLELTAEESAKVVRSGVWDFETRTGVDPVVRTWIAGTVTLTNDVTRTA